MMRKKLFIFSKIYYALFFIFLICLIGVIGFMKIEGYSILDAVYMTVITVSTVGFQEVVELSENGRLFTTFLIIASFGTFAYSVSVVTTYVISGDFNNYFKDYKVKKEIKAIKDHTIVCGFGRNGSQAVDKLLTYNESFVIIDNNPDCVQKLGDSKKYPFVSGDATLDENLENAGISRAKALISTLSSDADNLYVVLSARQKNKNLKIISRASFDESYSKLKIAGADNVIMPNKLGGAHMASLVTTPDVVEFLDNITMEGNSNINLEEISFKHLPTSIQNKTLKDLNARFHTGCNIIGFKTNEGKYVFNPNGDTQLVSNSKLFVLGTSEQIKQLNNLLNIQ